MDQQYIDAQREKLEAELQRLDKELADFGVKTGEGYKPLPGEFGDSSDDTARNTEAYETNLATEKPLLELKEKVLSALKRITTNEYGFCMVGGTKHAIEHERLEAFPEADTCIEHA